MAAPVIVQPDLEAWVWANIKELTRLGDLTSFAYSSAQLGGPGWVYAHFVQIDARHKRKEAARALAETVRQTVIGLPDVPWPEGTVCYVQAVEGPFWLPDDDGTPRYTAR